MLFEKLGFKYFGPIDGHDLPLLIKTLEDLKQINGPVMLHIATTKGKGYSPAEDDAFKYHGIGKFDKVTGKAAASSANLPAYTSVFGKVMCELAEKDKQVVAITAAMCSGTGLVEYSETYPERFFDVGIAEAHATTFAGGLAADGIKPYLSIYSTFLQRAYDQVIHDLAIQKLPVVICMDRAGLVGEDGPTHHGVFDIAYLSTVPNLTLCAPKDGNELRSMLHYTVDHPRDEIVAVRYPRDTVPVALTAEIQPIAWGKWEWLTLPSQMTILAVGSMVHPALKASQELSEKGVDIAVVNARFIKPFDATMLEQIKSESRVIVTIEEGQLRGGFGQAIAEHLLSSGWDGKFKAMAIPDGFVTHGSRAQLLKDVSLDPASIAANLEQFLSQQAKGNGGFLQRLILNGFTRRKDIVKNVG